MIEDKFTQPHLLPQDLVLLLYCTCLPTHAPLPSFSALAKQLQISPSQALYSVRRCKQAKLIFENNNDLSIIRESVRDLTLGGAAYVFPPRWGSVVAGIPTSSSVAPLNRFFPDSTDLVPVWPSPGAKLRGLAIAPLHPRVPLAVVNNAGLYERLALFDALRAGNARERDLARQLLAERI